MNISGSFDVRINGKLVESGVNYPKSLDEFGLNDLRAYAYSVGDQLAQDQIKKGNELSVVMVDGSANKSPTTMRRDISWYFSLNNQALIKAVSESLEMLRKLSMTYARQATGKMAGSWDIYINGKKSTLFDLEDIKIGDGKDIRISSPLPYARWLESSHWAGGTALRKRVKRAQRQIDGKRYRGHIAVTKTVANSMRNKYRNISISDVWYDTNENPFTQLKGGKDRRHPAIKFRLKKGVI